LRKTSKFASKRKRASHVKVGRHGTTKGLPSGRKNSGNIKELSKKNSIRRGMPMGIFLGGGLLLFKSLKSCKYGSSSKGDQGASGLTPKRTRLDAEKNQFWSDHGPEPGGQERDGLSARSVLRKKTRQAAPSRGGFLKPRQGSRDQTPRIANGALNSGSGGGQSGRAADDR